MLFAHCGDEAADATCQALYPATPFCDLCAPVSQSQGLRVAAAGGARLSTGGNDGRSLDRHR